MKKDRTKYDFAKQGGLLFIICKTNVFFCKLLCVFNGKVREKPKPQIARKKPALLSFSGSNSRFILVLLPFIMLCALGEGEMRRNGRDLSINSNSSSNHCYFSEEFINNCVPYPGRRGPVKSWSRRAIPPSRWR